MLTYYKTKETTLADCRSTNLQLNGPSINTFNKQLIWEDKATYKVEPYTQHSQHKKQYNLKRLKRCAKVLYCIILHCLAVHCIAQYCTVLYYMCIMVINEYRTMLLLTLTHLGCLGPCYYLVITVIINYYYYFKFVYSIYKRL